MHILHLTPRYHPARGGAEHYIGEISARLVAAGHQVTVATSDALSFEYFWDPDRSHLDTPTDWERGVRILRFPVRHLPLHPPLAYRAIRRFQWFLSRLPASSPLVTVAVRLSRLAPATPTLWHWLRECGEHFDLVAGVNVVYEQFLAAGLNHARRTSRPFVVYPLTHLGDGPRPGATPMSQFYTMDHQRRLVHAADALMAITETERQFYLNQGYQGRSAVVPPGLAPHGIPLSSEDARRRLAQRYGDPTLIDLPLILSVSTLCYDKGTIDLIEAMRRLWATGRRANLVLAGHALAEFEVYWQTLPEEVRRRIHRPGAVSEEEKQTLFRAATCFAMPSRVDSFGIVFLEAWEQGKPVIGARAWGISEDVIHHEQDGLLVPFGDVPALSAAIVRLLDDPVLASELGRRGRHAVGERYTWDRAMAVLLPLYEELGQSAA